MTNHEWQQVWEVFSALWPRITEKLSAEEEASYRRAMNGLTVDEARESIRAWKDTRPRFPQPPDLRQFARSRRQAEPGSEAGRASTWHDAARRLWARMPGANPQAIAAMSDADVELHQAHYDWEGAVAVSGAASESATHRWLIWQRLLKRHGYRETHPEREEYISSVSPGIDVDSVRERIFSNS